MKTAVTVLLGEIRKSLLISWTYRVNWFTGLMTLGFIFVAINFLMGGGKFQPELVAFTLVGYLIWFYVVSAMSTVSYGLRNEMSAGTLEQMSMSPVPIGLTLIGRVLADMLVVTLQILLLRAGLSMLLDFRLPLRWEGLPVLLLTLLGVLGFGFMIAGAVLVFKQIESLVSLFQNVLAFLNGTMLPVTAMPAWMVAVSTTLPTTQGIVVMRKILLDGQSLASAWQDGSLVWLAVHSGIYFVLGWIVFGICERIAKERGSLGQY